jgi:Na+-driven multidrug efflux pump
MQMDAGRRLGASRKTMLAANLITVTLLSLCVGLVLAALLLPFSGHECGSFLGMWSSFV